MTMLYLCRHAIAEEPGPGEADEERALTTEGVAKFRTAARGFLAMVKKSPALPILTSPLLRARQTAEILREAVEKDGGRARVVVCQALGPGGTAEALLKAVRAAGGKKSQEVAAVGHEPLLSQWIGEICFGTGGQVLMKKGAMAAIELAEAGTQGRLMWLMQPGMLRRVVRES